MLLDSNGKWIKFENVPAVLENNEEIFEEITKDTVLEIQSRLK